MGSKPDALLTKGIISEPTTPDATSIACFCCCGSRDGYRKEYN